MHIFHGLRGVKKNHKSFNRLTKELCSLGLYFEPSVFDGSPKAILRKYIYKSLFLKIDKYVDILFALGDMGVNQYTKLGVSSDKVYGVPYFIDNNKIISPISTKTRDASKAEPVKLLYVGQLNIRKNVSLLIRSLKEVIDAGKNAELNIVGNGELELDLMKLTKELKIDSHVNFLGVKNHEELEEIYLNNDIFILPSLFDGWGAVSVEAMANGLPVLISDSCGSASIVKDDLHGSVFKSGSLESLTEKLNNLIENISLYQTREAFANRINYVRDRLSANAGQSFIVEAIKDTIK